MGDEGEEEDGGESEREGVVSEGVGQEVEKNEAQVVGVEAEVGQDGESSQRAVEESLLVAYVIGVGIHV